MYIYLMDHHKSLVSSQQSFRCVFCLFGAVVVIHPSPGCYFPSITFKIIAEWFLLSYQHHIMDPSTIQVESPVIIVSCGLVFNFLHKISYVWRHLAYLLFNFTTWWVSSSQDLSGRTTGSTIKDAQGSIKTQRTGIVIECRRIVVVYKVFIRRYI
jgi:hypothetical protein